jgi:hypothetical protein
MSERLIRCLVLVGGGASAAWGGVRPEALEPLLASLHARNFDCPECEHACAHAKTLRARFAANQNPDGSPIALSPPPLDYDDADLLRNDLRLEINPATQWVGGSNAMTLRSALNNLTQVRVRLQNIFAVTAARIGTTPVAAAFTDDRHLTVTLDRPYNADEEFTLTIEYNGFPQNNGFDSIQFTTQNGQPIVSTLSETDFAYTWWPTKDDNRDKSTADLRFTLPSTMSVASNGVLMSVTDVPGGKKEWYWKTAYPTATYLYSFAATNYTRFSGSYNWGGPAPMPLEFFIYPINDTPANRNAWLQTSQMLATYRPLFGLYPFINEKYGIYNFPFGGGMEHQTMTGQGTFSESVTAHELAHQWWGDMTTCAFWNDIWLNEGFATYAEALWLQYKPGSSGEPALHNAMNQRRPASVAGTVYIDEPLNNGDINRIFSTSFSYRKPAWVLHMLRHVVGDTTFFNMLAAYRAAFEYQSATTDDFIAVAESVHGQDLSWFFDQWIYDDGAPAYRRAWRNATVNGQPFVELFVQQTQTSPFPVFTMPLDIEFFINNVANTRTIWNNAAMQWYLLPVTAAPATVTLDPVPWVLATSNLSTAFQEGPPKVVAVSPAPGSTAPASFSGPITITFHKDVTTTSANYSLTRDGGGAPLFSFAYNSATRTTSLTPASPLPGGQYTLTISDAVIDALSSLTLDGELLDSASPASLPSGDGVPGGPAVVRFTVAAPPPCLGDADGSRTVDFADVTSVLSHWGATYPPNAAATPGDANLDLTVNFSDITEVLAFFGAACGS